jgi:hypothetical protein
MLNLFERGIASVDQRLILLAPPQASIPTSLNNVAFAPTEHRHLLDAVQRLRGSIYVRDGALQPSQLTADGRHATPEDDQSWHLIVTDAFGSVNGCIWYREHLKSPRLQELRVRECPLASTHEWRRTFRNAIEREIAHARRESIRYAEVGGWAVECRARCLSAGLFLILGTFALSQMAGGALVIATATVRNSSAKILRRLGGADLEADGRTVPSYYDPRYECMMELLRFDTRKPAEKYAQAVQGLKAHFANVQVFSRAVAEPAMSAYMRPSVLQASLSPAYASALA